VTLPFGITVDVAPLVAIQKRMRADRGFQNFLRDGLDLRPGQREYFFDLGVDGKKRVTLEERRIRADYYATPPAPGATATYPYMWWTGRTFAHTTHEKGRVSVRPGELRIVNPIESIDAGVDRPFAQQWWRVDVLARHTVRQIGQHVEGHYFGGDRIKRRAA